MRGHPFLFGNTGIKYYIWRILIMSFSDIIGVIDDWAWSYPLLILLVGTGLFLSIRIMTRQMAMITAVNTPCTIMDVYHGADCIP